MAILGSAVYNLLSDASGLNKGIDKAGKDSQKRLQNIGKKMTLAVTGPILGIGAAVFAASESIDRAMRTIRTGTGATGLDLQYLRRDFEAVLGKVPGDANAAAEAIAGLNTIFGLTGEPLQDAAESALWLAHVFEIDVATAVDTVGTAMQVYNLPASEFVNILDDLTTTSQLTNTPMSELLGTLDRYAPALSAIGLSMPESIALIGQLHAAGIPARRAMSGLQTATAKLADEGFPTMREALDDLVNRIKNAPTDMDAMAIAAEYFGTESGPVWSEAIRNGVFDLDDLLLALQNNTGALNDLGEGTLTATDKMAMMRQEINERLAGAWDKLPVPMQTVLLVMGLVLAAIGPLLTAFSGMVIAIRLGAFSMAASWLIAAWPIAAILLGLALLVAAGWFLYQNWGKMWPLLKDLFLDGANYIIGKLNGVIDAINGVIRGLNLIHPFKDIPYIPKIKKLGGLRSADEARRVLGEIDPVPGGVNLQGPAVPGSMAARIQEAITGNRPGGGTGNTYQAVFEGPVYGDDDLEQHITDMVDRAVRRGVEFGTP